VTGSLIASASALRQRTSRVSHSQITSGIHSMASNCSETLRSRATLASNFARQNSGRVAGFVAYVHPGCRCQKQPWTKITVRNLGSTRSGRPGRPDTCNRYLNPCACRYRRTRSSGFVSADPIAAIIRERVRASTTSTINCWSFLES